MNITGIESRRNKNDQPYYIIHASEAIPAGQGFGSRSENSGYMDDERMKAALNGQRVEDVIGARVIFDRTKTGFLRGAIIQKSTTAPEKR